MLGVDQCFALWQPAGYHYFRLATHSFIHRLVDRRCTMLPPDIECAWARLALPAWQSFAIDTEGRLRLKMIKHSYGFAKHSGWRGARNDGNRS